MNKRKARRPRAPSKYVSTYPRSPASCGLDRDLTQTNKTHNFLCTDYPHQRRRPR